MTTAEHHLGNGESIEVDIRENVGQPNEPDWKATAERLQETLDRTLEFLAHRRAERDEARAALADAQVVEAEVMCECPNPVAHKHQEGCDGWPAKTWPPGEPMPGMPSRYVLDESVELVPKHGMSVYPLDVNDAGTLYTCTGGCGWGWRTLSREDAQERWEKAHSV